MRLLSLLAVYALVLSACQFTHGMTGLPPAHAKPLRKRDGSSTVLVDCYYEMAHCERAAYEECRGPYEVLQRGSQHCADCGFSFGSAPGTPVWLGTLEVRCQ